MPTLPYGVSAYDCSFLLEYSGAIFAEYAEMHKKMAVMQTANISNIPKFYMNVNSLLLVVNKIYGLNKKI